MDRRTALQVAGVGLAALAVPGWFVATRPRRSAGEDSPFSIALDSARRRGRPLLVLCADDAWHYESFQLGQIIGVFLLQATDEQLSTLAPCEITTATLEDLEGLVPRNALPTTAGWMLLDSAPDSEVVFRPLTIPEFEGDYRSDDFPEQVEAYVLERNAALAREFAAVLVEDTERLARLAALERDAVGAPPSNAELSVLARGWPAQALQLARAEPGRAEWHAALAAAVRERYRTTAPRGTTWAEQECCGLAYDQPPNSPKIGVSCGSAVIQDISRRFLYIYRAIERPD